MSEFTRSRVSLHELIVRSESDCGGGVGWRNRGAAARNAVRERRRIALPHSQVEGARLKTEGGRRKAEGGGRKRFRVFENRFLIPTGLRRSAQGCVEGATLGESLKHFQP